MEKEKIDYIIETLERWKNVRLLKGLTYATKNAELHSFMSECMSLLNILKTASDDKKLKSNDGELDMQKAISFLYRKGYSVKKTHYAEDDPMSVSIRELGRKLGEQFNRP